MSERPGAADEVVSLVAGPLNVARGLADRSERAKMTGAVGSATASRSTASTRSGASTPVARASAGTSAQRRSSASRLPSAVISVPRDAAAWNSATARASAQRPLHRGAGTDEARQPPILGHAAHDDDVLDGRRTARVPARVGRR
jgi:hypothetical protein